MPVRQYRTPETGFGNQTFFIDYENHKLPNGKVDTNQQGGLTYLNARVINTSQGIYRYGDIDIPFPGIDCDVAASHTPPSYEGNVNRLRAEARARLDGKLRYGKAELGVSLGSWRQSWDMIAKRAHTARAAFENVEKRLLRDRHSTQRLRLAARQRARDRAGRENFRDNQYLETPANLVLEGEFGWLPLFSDAKAAFGVMARPLPNGWVTGRASTVVGETFDSEGDPRIVQRWDGRQKCSIACNVRVDNPNLWLLNMLGLLNLPGTAWDLVPWSFVANMFTNLGQIANSFTSHYGLAFENISVTESIAYTLEETLAYAGDGMVPARTSAIVKRKTRVAGAIPAPPFVFRMPELNAELALIAVSLAIQQVSRVTRLIR